MVGVFLFALGALALFIVAAVYGLVQALEQAGWLASRHSLRSAAPYPRRWESRSFYGQQPRRRRRPA